MLKVLAEADARAATVVPDEPVTGYVISITRGGRHRKLHHVGSCRLVPGHDYKEFEPWGEVLPPASELNSRCKRCFGTTVLAPDEEEGSDIESMESSSSSSSGSHPAPKKAKKR